MHQLCVLTSLLQQAVELAHNLPTATHLGTLQTYQDLQNNYHFPNILREVWEYAQRCNVSQKRSSIGWAEMQGRSTASGPLDLVRARTLRYKGILKRFSMF